MKLLLDTHVLLWWYNSPDKLTDEATELISDTTNTVYLSAVTIWEIIIKQSLGKLTIPKDLLKTSMKDFEELPISWKDSLAINNLELIHNDPFDRLLIAQALNNNLILLTRDKNIIKYKVPFKMA